MSAIIFIVRSIDICVLLIQINRYFLFLLGPTVVQMLIVMMLMVGALTMFIIVLARKVLKPGAPSVGVEISMNAVTRPMPSVPIHVMRDRTNIVSTLMLVILARDAPILVMYVCFINTFILMPKVQFSRDGA